MEVIKQLMSCSKVISFTLIVSLLAACELSEESLNGYESTKNFFDNRLSAEEQSDSNLKRWYEWDRDYHDEITLDDGTVLAKGTVEYVVDGDTADIRLSGSDQIIRTRFILVDTPESKGEYAENPQPYAIHAYEFTKSMIEGEQVFIEKGKDTYDPYDRMLVYIWLPGVAHHEEVSSGENVNITDLNMVTLNELLLREGLAEIAVFPPNEKYKKEFKATEKQAIQKNRGKWQE